MKKPGGIDLTLDLRMGKQDLEFGAEYQPGI
jgi:hypothetical protein